MKIKIRFDIYDLLFYLLLVFSFYFTRNILCRIMMVVFWGYTIYQQIIYNRKFQIPFFAVGFLAFVLYGAVNILLGNVINTQTAQTMVISLFLNFLMILALVQYIYFKNNIPDTLRLVELGIFTAALMVVLLSIRTITQGRLGGATEMNSNMLAMLCVYGFVLSIYLRKIAVFSKKQHIFRLFFYALVILLTGSRKGLIMIVLAIFAVRFVPQRRAVLKKLLISVGIVAVLYILIMSVDVLYNNIGVRMENIFELIVEGKTNDGSLQSRQLLAKIGMAYIKEKPWTGYGYDCFKLISRMNASGSIGAGEVGYYSHNNYIELLFSGGIIGFALYYIPVMYLLQRLWKLRRKDTCVLYLAVILIAKLSIEYAYVSYYNRMDTYIIAIILGCISSIPNQNLIESGQF